MGRKRKQRDLEEAIEETKLNGHNKPELTDDEKRALLLQHKRSYEISLSAKKAADAEFKNICKRAKAECGKDAVADIKDAIAFEQPGGQGAFNEEMARKHKVARWMGLPVGSEPSFFEATDRRQAIDVAYDSGKSAGMIGDTCQPPHDPSVPQYQRWIEGWHDGQAIIASAFEKIKPEPSAPPPAAEQSEAQPAHA